MKKVFSSRVLVTLLFFVTSIVGIYLYQRGKISFFPRKEKIAEPQEFFSDIPFTEKEYSLFYKEKDWLKVREIARFEETENWVGDGILDYSNFFEGKSSLSLSSQNHYRSKAILELKEGIRFEDFLNCKLIVNLGQHSLNIEQFNLLLADNNSKILYQYPIREEFSGWNILVFPVREFSSFDTSTENISLLEQKDELKNKTIEKVIFELVSRPKSSVSINLDFMWLEEDDSYAEDWNTNDSEFLALGRDNSSLSLLITGQGEVANLKKISFAKNYSIKAKFIPLKKGTFGFFLRGNFKNGLGYYLMMDGVGTDTWKISKVGVFDNKEQEINLAKGSLNNFKMNENQSYWLKSELIDNNLILFFSLDGKDYVKVGEARDKSFPLGGVGVASGGGCMFLVDEIYFSQ